MNARRLTVALALLACGGESEPARDTFGDTVAPIGAGTERLLTRERLTLLDEWIAAMIARGIVVRASLEDARPPSDEASRYVPLERYRRDGWGRRIEYDYRSDARFYELRSSGDDGMLGTEDDITVRSAVPTQR